MFLALPQNKDGIILCSSWKIQDFILYGGRNPAGKVCCFGARSSFSCPQASKTSNDRDRRLSID